MRNRTNLALYLKKAEEPISYRREPFIVRYTLLIKDQLNEKCVKKSMGNVEIDYFEEKIGNLINYKEASKSRSYRFLYNSQLQAVIYLEIIKKNVIISNLLHATLSSHYEKIFNNETYSDFLIITSDDQSIYVHKNILSMRSPVFQAMINSKMIEGEQKKVKIDDIDPRALTELIRFIYSGKVNEIESIAGDLLYAANKYDLQDLKPLCIESLALNLTPSNVLETFLLADLHQEKALKKFCLDFIKWKYDDVKEQEGWADLNSSIMKEVLDFMMSPAFGKKQESTITTHIKRTAQAISTIVDSNNNNDRLLDI